VTRHVPEGVCTTGMVRGSITLHRVLSDAAATGLVVGDWAGWRAWGWDTRKVLFVSGGGVGVFGREETTSDLVWDITEVVTSVCAGLYGERSAKNGAAGAVVVVGATGVAW
jgi:putative resolvase